MGVAIVHLSRLYFEIELIYTLGMQSAAGYVVLEPQKHGAAGERSMVVIRIFKVTLW